MIFSDDNRLPHNPVMLDEVISFIKPGRGTSSLMVQLVREDIVVKY